MRKQAQSPVIVLLRGLQTRRIWRDGCKGLGAWAYWRIVGVWRIGVLDL